MQPVTTPYTEEDVELIRAVLPLDPSDGTMPIGWGSDGIPTWGQPDEVIRGILDALAGRLVPPGSETREEWGTRHLDIETCKRVTSVASNRAAASASFDYLNEVWGHHAELVHRKMITTPWSCSVPDTGPETP